MESSTTNTPGTCVERSTPLVEALKASRSTSSTPIRVEQRPGRLIMPSVMETGETMNYEGFVAKGFGIVRLGNEDIDPHLDAQPMECHFNLATGDVMVETVKRVGH